MTHLLSTHMRSRVVYHHLAPHHPHFPHLLYHHSLCNFTCQESPHSHKLETGGAHYINLVDHNLPPRLRKDFTCSYPLDYSIDMETLKQRLEESEWHAKRLAEEVEGLKKERILVFKETRRKITSMQHTWKNLIYNKGSRVEFF